MAIPWIKIETTTPTKPEVVRMAALLRLNLDEVLGKLVRIWCWADAQSIDGKNVQVSADFLDKLAGKKGFSKALREVGWMDGDDFALTFPNFQKHNGESAKKRNLDSARKEAERERTKAGKIPDGRAQSVTPKPGQMSRSEADKTRTDSGPDKIRGEIRERDLPRACVREDGGETVPEKWPAPVVPSRDEPVAAHVPASALADLQVTDLGRLVEECLRTYPVNGKPDTARLALFDHIRAMRRTEEDRVAYAREILGYVHFHAEKFNRLPPGERRFCPALHTYFSEGCWIQNPNEAPWTYHENAKPNGGGRVVATPVNPAGRANAAAVAAGEYDLPTVAVHE